MQCEREKMLGGALYNPMDPELVAGRERARNLCAALFPSGSSLPAIPAA